ncbi:MAG TPA: MFS transporter [Myxococcaceae bacterium]|nr:MFS transporter [Myxococcaceae bacterium]
MIEKEIVPPPEPTAPEKLKHAWPPLFALLEFQFGAGVGYLQTAVPYWLGLEGIPLDIIGGISGAANSAHFWKLFWVPLVDLGPWRRTWYAVCTVGTAAMVVACSVMSEPTKHLATYTALLFALQAFCSTAHAAVNGLMATTTRIEDKGRTGGWQMAGNVGSTSLLGTLPIKLTTLWSRQAAGITVALIVLASGMAVFWVPDRPGEASPAGLFLRAAAARVKEIALDIFHTAFSRDGAVMLILCLAPVSCGALTNLFSAMARDFAASEGVVTWVNGPGMAISGAVGSLLGGYVADRINRKVNYAIWGGVTAICGLGLAFVPFNQTTYTVGTLAYSMANGCAFAAFAGMVLEMVTSGAGVTTKYTLFVAASNLAISYTTQLDGKASTWPIFMGGGARGTILFDALITFGGIGVVVLLFLTVLRKKPAGPRVTAGTG